ncbi:MULTISPECIES: propionate--CoA ligase [Microvirgula]|uniref:Propionate--CoA ligase n=1 Tax=Microvirgula aerodenitrificans TaxID=57480 RepID=A0A2S0PCF3_9NEIS|nr:MULTISPECIES: propionate--CoA ligase [Microvirgula]AVY95064.1 propionate--CoA ligase [Microvirgula aerodenitrificans]RAS15959.1 propionyl-CoA synthetase [Microvirgula sp. AG722]
MSHTLQAFHRRSIESPDAFWDEQARRIDWHTPYRQVLDDSQPPFRRWFVDGTTNLCHNAVDRHLAERGDQAALIHISTETGAERQYSYAELHREVNRCAAVLSKLGVSKGDRVLIYMPMIPEAIFAMLATVRLGAIHSVVFGGFASASLATRIDDAQPKVIFTADAGMRGGKHIPYKPLVDAAIDLAGHKPEHVVIVERGLDPDMPITQCRDLIYATLLGRLEQTEVPCEWVESNHPSYILYTSGTTGKPKGVQRDTGGYAVALAASMENIYCGAPGETFFCTSDIGWVVGHSYIVYAPLLRGMTTIVYEGLPTRPDPGVWWSIVEKYRVSVMFSAPTALRALKKQDPAWLKKYDLSSLRYLFMAGEPLDQPTADWITAELGVPVVDNYWQTETGWPMLSAMPGIEKTPLKNGSPSFPVYGYNVQLLNEVTGQPVARGEKGVIAVLPPLPPGCLSTIWQQDERYVNTYFHSFGGTLAYSSFDWGTQDEDGYFYVLGRTDDVINVAGHRLGTREIEEAASNHSAIAEVAVVGVADALKGQVPVAFAVLKDPSLIHDDAQREALARDVIAMVGRELGAIANPSDVMFVTQLPKTRSGKVLRRSIQAIAEGRDPGDLTTLDDPTGLDQVRQAVAARHGTD